MTAFPLAPRSARDLMRVRYGSEDDIRRESEFLFRCYSDPQMGRPSKLTPAQQQEARQRRDDGATLEELASSYNVGEATIRRATRAA
jgi:hypothetical protein